MKKNEKKRKKTKKNEKKRERKPWRNGAENEAENRHETGQKTTDKVKGDALPGAIGGLASRPARRPPGGWPDYTKYRSDLTKYCAPWGLQPQEHSAAKATWYGVISNQAPCAAGRVCPSTAWISPDKKRKFELKQKNVYNKNLAAKSSKKRIHSVKKNPHIN